MNIMKSENSLAKFRNYFWGLAVFTFLLLCSGLYTAFFVAPPDRMMGEVYRIMFIHVPAAWMSLLAYTITFLLSVGYLLKKRLWLDDLAAASAEVGLVFNGVLLCTGALWGKPTWGVYWTWDPRLTTAAVMAIGFAGYLMLRSLMGRDVIRRASISSVVALMLWLDIPLVWFSVRWWNSLHQVQSSPSTMDANMVLALRVNAFAFLSLYVLFCGVSFVLARRRAALCEIGKTLNMMDDRKLVLDGVQVMHGMGR